VRGTCAALSCTCAQAEPLGSDLVQQPHDRLRSFAVGAHAHALHAQPCHATHAPPSAFARASAICAGGGDSALLRICPPAAAAAQALSASAVRCAVKRTRSSPSHSSGSATTNSSQAFPFAVSTSAPLSHIAACSDPIADAHAPQRRDPTVGWAHAPDRAASAPFARATRAKYLRDANGHSTRRVQRRSAARNSTPMA
jgi:hypothetical protein